MLKKLSLLLVYVSFHLLSFTQTQQERGHEAVVMGRVAGH